MAELQETTDIYTKINADTLAVTTQVDREELEQDLKSCEGRIVKFEAKRTVIKDKLAKLK